MMLPLEILLSIFQHLGLKERLRLRTVCRSWSTLLLHPAVLRHLDLSYYWQSSDERYLDVALSYATNVVSLRLDYCDPIATQLSGRSLIQASRNGKLKKLKLLSLVCTTLSDETMNNILEGTQTVEYLDLNVTLYGETVANSIATFTSHSLRYMRFPERFWRRQPLENILDSCHVLECFSISIEMFSWYLMEALLCKKKWSNIKKVIIHPRSDDRKTEDYYLLRAAKNIAPIKSNLVVCLCAIPVKGYTKAILRNLKVNVCDCGLRVE